MEGVPSPLQVGSPVVARKPSVEQVPSALRVGSSVIPDSGPPLMRQNTSGSDRLSQLFPSRPASIASASPSQSRRTSYPSPLMPALEPAYRIPRAPAPPSLAEETSPDPFEQQQRPIEFQHSGTKRLLNRLTSLRSRNEYNKLEDEESSPLGRRRLRDVEEADEPIGYDLSGYDTHPMKKLEPKRTTSTAQRDLTEAGHAAEFDRLEAAQLGAGMSSIMEVPFTHQQDVPDHGEGAGLRRGPSTTATVAAASQAAQKEAEKSERIVAVADIPLDISDSFGGADFETHGLNGAGRDDGSKTSYYFPPDPDMPAWRPFSMRWPWLSMLVTIALVLAVLQECVCQLSIKRVKEDKTGYGGLIKFKNPKELTVTEYFTWKYAPVLFLIVYGILWQVTDFEVKRLEAYYQLSKKTGATAAESLNMDYLTFMSWLVPLRALRHKQYAVIYVSLSTLVASSLVPILQSASVITYPPDEKRDKDEWKAIRIDPPWSRAVTICLVFVAISGSVLMYAMRRRSGLLSDPKGIAGIAAMATRSHILAEFHGLDTAPLDKIHKQLRHRRYILHKSSLWQGEYIRHSNEKLHEVGSDPRPLMLRLRAGVPYIAYLILFALSIPFFLFVEKANKITETLPFLLTALATLIKLLWATLNCDVRMLEPFFILSRRQAPAKTLTLDYTGTNPIFLPFKALVNRHYIVALVGFGSILTEILTVCVSSFSVDGRRFIPGHGHDDDDDDKDSDRSNTDETFRSFWVSFSLVIGIMFILVSIACLVYTRRAHKFMPRQIGTMASVLAFIHQSKMLVNFVDTETFDSGKMTKELEKQGKTYALGWFSGRDGDDHCGIDEEPILSEYRYGVDWRKTRVLGDEIGRWEHY